MMTNICVLYASAETKTLIMDKNHVSQELKNFNLMHIISDSEAQILEKKINKRLTDSIPKKIGKVALVGIGAAAAAVAGGSAAIGLLGGQGDIYFITQLMVCGPGMVAGGGVGLISMKSLMSRNKKIMCVYTLELNGDISSFSLSYVDS